MPQSIKELATQRKTLFDQNWALLKKAEDEGRTLNTEEVAQYDKCEAELQALDQQIQDLTDHETRVSNARARQTDLDRPLPRQIPAGDPGKPKEESVLTLPLGGGRDLLLRPGTPEFEMAQDSYRANFVRYLSGGSGEQLGLKVSQDSVGGYLAPTTFSARLIQALDNSVFMRQLGTVLPPLTQAVSIGIPSYDTDVADADWTAEVPASDISEDTTARFGKREMTPHLLTKLIKMSMKLLRSAVIDVEAFMIERMRYKLAVTEESAFLEGDGAQTPLGVFTATDDGIGTARDTTCASQTAFTYDEILNCLFSLKEGYQRNATWLVSREFVKRCRKLKDGNGRPLWGEGIEGGSNATIVDRPYRMSEYVPSTYTTGLYVAAVGDLRYYWIVDSLAIEVQRLGELFSLKNQVGVLVRKETDGMPVLAEAFARLKMA